MPVTEHLAVLTYLVEIGKPLQRGTLVTSVSFGLGAEHRHKWVVAQLLCLFVFGNRARKVSFRLKRNAEIIVRVKGCWIDVERLPQLRDSLVVAVGVIEGFAQVRVNNYRQRIYLNRALTLGNGLLESSEAGQDVVA